MANRNFLSKFLYTMHAMPVLVDCSFVVDNTQPTGISNLKGPLIQAVYMNATTPSSLNPNPAAGTIVVQLQDNYSRLFSALHAIASPTSGSALKVDNSALTQGVAYSITTLGDFSTASWHTLGVPAGITPAVGVTFIAASTGAGANTSTSRVMAMAATGSGVASIELVSDSNSDISPDPTQNQGFGAQFLLQCHDYAGALVAPAPGSIIKLAFYLSNSSVQVAGE